MLQMCSYVVFKCLMLHVFHTVWRVNRRRSDGGTTRASENCWAPNLGSSVHHVSVPRSVADTHNSNKIDIKNHTFIANGETYYMVWVTWLGPLALYHILEF